AHGAAAAAVEAEVRLQLVARGEEAAAGAAGDLEADAEVARRRRLGQRAREAELRGRRGAGCLEAAARPRPPARPHEPALEERLAQVRRLDEPGRTRGRPDDAGLERREPGRVAELVDARGRARAEVAAEVERAALQLVTLRRVSERGDEAGSQPPRDGGLRAEAAAHVRARRGLARDEPAEREPGPRVVAPGLPQLSLDEVVQVVEVLAALARGRAGEVAAQLARQQVREPDADREDARLAAEVEVAPVHRRLDAARGRDVALEPEPLDALRRGHGDDGGDRRLRQLHLHRRDGRG